MELQNSKDEARIAKKKEDLIEKIREANALQGWKNRLEERHDDRMKRYGCDPL